MNTLDNQKVLARFNKSRVADSISRFPEQMEEAWEEALKINLSKTYSNCRHLVFCGMGGSNLASELTRSVFSSQIKNPFILVHNYHLPQFVSRDSLVIISSYSGNTEEALSCFREAIKIKAKIICFTSGGKLLALAQKNKILFYQISKKFNPSGQPRYGVGSQLGAVLAILAKSKIINLNSREIKEGVNYLNRKNLNFNLNSEKIKNQAKQLAEKLFGRLVILSAAEFLSANAHIIANQINESAKNLAWSQLIPELNHHLLEGLSLPKEVRQKTTFFFLESSLYEVDIAKRFKITKKVLTRQKINYQKYQVQAKNRFLAALETLSFGSWLSFYLAVLNNQNPAGVPWVEYFKKELGK